jgi:hypothetical protein
MPALYFHCGKLWRLACDARDRAERAVELNKDAWPYEAVVAVILAAAASEAFINELAQVMVMTRGTRGQRGVPLPSALSDFADKIEEIEKARGRTTEKYLAASQALGGKMFDKGKSPYQDFALLMTLRNDIMHLRPRDTFEEELRGQDVETTVRWPKYLACLQSRGLAQKVDCLASWFDLLATAALSRWACDTALLMILAILDLVPDTVDDPSRLVKDMFRRFAT